MSEKSVQQHSTHKEEKGGKENVAALKVFPLTGGVLLLQKDKSTMMAAIQKWGF